jgi:DNA/RNA-binding domain of Phe-tRNA-synthetase-like protein
MQISFSPLIQKKIFGLKLGILAGKNLTINNHSDLVRQQLSDVTIFIKEKFANQPPSKDPIISAVRRMYRRIGWEPTQYRPSSEAMIRRFIKDKGLYRINNVVDLGNIVSTRFHLPMGLYDRDKIIGSIQVDVGQEREEYKGISKNVIHAKGKLILRDDLGIFGNPTADSLRTSIQNNTMNVLALFFTPPEVTDLWLEQTLDFLKNLYTCDCPRTIINLKTIICD